MNANVIEVLDLAGDQGSMVCSVERYSVRDEPNAGLILSWNDTTARDGFQAVGGGVAHVRVPSLMIPEQTTAAPDNLGDGRFAWRDTTHTGNMIVVIVLPVDYVIKELRDTHPSSVRFKVFNGRMAFYWDIGKKTTDVTWKVAKRGNRKLDKLVAELNRAAIAAKPVEHAVVVDKEPGTAPDTPPDPAPSLPESIPDTSSVSTPLSPPSAPQTAAEFLIDAARRVPALVYTIGVVGLTAAAAISLGFTLGNWEYALVGGLTTFVGTVLVRLYAWLQPADEKISVSTLVKVILWTCVTAFVVVLIMAVVKLGFHWFNKPAPQLDTNTTHNSRSDINNPQIAESIVAPVVQPVVAKEFEISSLEFSEEYEKRATTGAWPQFDLKLRNPTNEPVVISGLRFNVKKFWKLEPTPDPISKPVAEVLRPSAIYDVVIGQESEQEGEGKAADFRDGKLGFGTLGVNKDPDIKTFTKKVSHVIKAGDADHILLNYQIAREFSYIDPGSLQPSRNFMITPLYVVLLDITILYNINKEVTSSNLLFVHYINHKDRQQIESSDTGVDGFGRNRSDRIERNCKAVADFSSSRAQKSPSIQYVSKLIEELAKKPVK